MKKIIILLMCVMVLLVLPMTFAAHEVTMDNGSFDFEGDSIALGDYISNHNWTFTAEEVGAPDSVQYNDTYLPGTSGYAIVYGNDALGIRSYNHSLFELNDQTRFTIEWDMQRKTIETNSDFSMFFHNTPETNILGVKLESISGGTDPVFFCGGATTDLTTTDYLAETWYHFILNYVDGIATAHVNHSATPGVWSSYTCNTGWGDAAISYIRLVTATPFAQIGAYRTSGGWDNIQVCKGVGNCTDTIKPSGVSLNGNNFFATTNDSIIGSNESNAVLLNFTFRDESALQGFTINITDALGNTLYNLTNTSMNNSFASNFSVIINTSGSPQGWVNVLINVTDKAFNYNSSTFKFYLSNVSIDWFSPTTTTNAFSDTITVSLNVTGDGRNSTMFLLHNTSHDLVRVDSVNMTGTGSYFYNITFTNVTNNFTFYVNATHIDVRGENSTSTTLIFSPVFLNIAFYDEVLDTLIDWNTITMDVVGNDFAQNYSTTTGKIYVGGWADGDYRFTYDSDKYSKRSYYYTLQNITNHSIIVYLLSTGNGTDVTFTVQDNSGDELENATIRLKKYFVGTNSYRTVAMARTNTEGETSIDVDFNDAFYEILATYKSYSLETIGAKIITTTLILTLDLLADPFESIDIIEDIDTSIDFNEITQTFSYTFTDTTGQSRTGKIDVYKITPTDESLMCSNTDTSSSATLLCQVNTTNTTGTYNALGSIIISGWDITTDNKEIITGVQSEFKEAFGNQATFFGIIVVGTLAGLGAVVSASVGIIMFMVGLAIVMNLGLTIFGFVTYMTFAIIAAVIVYKMKK